MSNPISVLVIYHYSIAFLPVNSFLKFAVTSAFFMLHTHSGIINLSEPYLLLIFLFMIIDIRPGEFAV